MGLPTNCELVSGGSGPRHPATIITAARSIPHSALKGGFSGGEDYRWKEVRSWFPGLKYEVFNLVFVCVFQQLEILAFTVRGMVGGGLTFSTY